MHPVEFRFAKFDLTLYLMESDAGLEGMFEYSTDLFDEATIARMASHLTVLLNSMVSQPDQPVLQLPMLTETEYHHLLHEWNDTEVDLGEPATIHALFEAQVTRSPDAVALISSDDGLTYAELNARANQLAHYLIAQGVQPNVLVGICVERQLSMVVGLLAILKAGGAYVPLDPSLPSERLAFMLEDANVSVLLSDKKLTSKLQINQTTKILDFDSIAVTANTATPLITGIADDLAYVIYTSGSTGQPKGVEGLHRGAVNRLRWMWETFPFGSGEVCCAKTTLSFVDSIAEIFAPLLQGIPVVIANDAAAKDPHQLVQLLASSQVTRLVLVPSLLRSLLDIFPNLHRRLPKLKFWVSSGEALSSHLCQRFHDMMPDRILLNMYGSSEVSADVTFYNTSCKISDSTFNNTKPAQTSQVSIPIGRPIANTQVYILDSNLQPVPQGVVGELYIGGAGVARGYLNRPHLTAEKFVPNPFGSGTLYRMGDLCRYLSTSNGAFPNLEFVGRTDHQVKIRGFRIELGEIESVLLAGEGVREAVVLARAVREDKQLVAYIVGDADSNALRQQLTQRLPEYMVPSAFVTLDAMPLTPSGKLDRRALPAPDYVGLATNHIPAETFDEARLVFVWQEVLGVHPIGVKDNFFELGGHSLLATQLVHKMREVLQRDISLQQLFKSPTIRGLLRATQAWRALDEESSTSFIPLRASDKSTSDNRSPLFLIHPANGVVFPYANLLPYISSTQPVYALQARGIYDDLPLFESLESLATAAISEMKTIQPDGPYAIGGWSFGGMAAFEIAYQLTQRGDAVSFLGLMDTYPRLPVQAKPLDSQARQKDLKAFLDIFADFLISRDYDSLSDELFINAVEQELPIDWLLDQISQQGYQFVMDQSTFKRIWLTRMRNAQLMQNYRPQHYKGRITFFCTQESAPEERIQGWQALTSGSVDTIWIGGDHMSMLNVENVEKLGRGLEKRLQPADSLRAPQAKG